MPVDSCVGRSKCKKKITRKEKKRKKCIIENDVSVKS
jgi:hypothetical protein